MHPFLLTAMLYLLVSSVITGAAILGTRGAEEKFSLLDWLLFFLLAPILVGVVATLDWIYPSSGDPFDLVYAKLSFSEEKNAAQIADEIKADGQTVGGSRNETRQVTRVLEAMMSLGFARRKEVNLEEIFCAHLQGMVEKYGGDNQELKADLEQLAALAAIEDDGDDPSHEVFYVYLRGNPPSKRGKWRRLIQLRPSFRPLAI